MWIFTRYGFFSVSFVDKETFNVRARSFEHLETLWMRFPQLKSCVIERTPDADYKWRMAVPKTVWVEVMAKLASEQTWSNVKAECASFKEEIGQPDPIYSRAMHNVWEEMFDAGVKWDQEGKVG